MVYLLKEARTSPEEAICTHCGLKPLESLEEAMASPEEALCTHWKTTLATGRKIFHFSVSNFGFCTHYERRTTRLPRESKKKNPCGAIISILIRIAENQPSILIWKHLK
jgi:hypothetical protein